MSTIRFALPNGGRLEVYTEPFSDVLVAEGTAPLNRLARAGAAVATRQVRPSGRRFIGVKTVKEFDLRSSDIGRPRSELSSKLRVPVALIVNNSRYAVEQEVGSLKADRKPERPLRTAFNQLRAERGVRGVVEPDLNAAVTFGTRSRAARRKKGRR